MFRHIYVAVRGWTDRQIRNGYAKFSMIVPAVLPLLFGVWAVGGSTQEERMIRTAPFVVWAVLWVGFWIWRFWLYLRREARKGDRYFDIWGKKILPPEYADTESAAKAKRRGK